MLLADLPYEELISHRYTFHGAPSVGNWPALPFAGPVLQAEPLEAGGVLLRTPGGLWLGPNASSLHACHASFSDGLLLAGGAGAVEHAKGVSTLTSDGATCSEVLVATFGDDICAGSVAAGWMNATSGVLIVGCGDGLFAGAASPRSPRPLEREASVQGPVVAAAGWAAQLCGRRETRRRRLTFHTLNVRESPAERVAECHAGKDLLPSAGGCC